MFWEAIAERRSMTRAELDAVFTRSDRLEIYGAMYVNRLIDALRGEFPRLAAQLGDDAFFELAEAYVREHPSVDPSINAIGRELPRFLRRHRRYALARLATLERTRALVFDARDDIALGAHALADVRADVLPRVRFSPVAALALVGNTAVFRRDYVVHDVELDGAGAKGLARMMKGRTLASICDAFADDEDPARAAYAAVGSWFASGWIRAVRF